jgi:hypothetical protein
MGTKCRKLLYTYVKRGYVQCRLRGSAMVRRRIDGHEETGIASRSSAISSKIIASIASNEGVPLTGQLTTKSSW